MDWTVFGFGFALHCTTSERGWAEKLSGLEHGLYHFLPFVRDQFLGQNKAKVKPSKTKFEDIIEGDINMTISSFQNGLSSF